MRITAFIGAGGALEIGGPTTSGITSIVRRKKQNYFNKSTYFIDRVAKVLDAHYGELANFEEIFHTLELINSYKTGWKGAVKKYTPYMTAFSKPRHSRFFKEDIILNVAKRDLLVTVAKIINNYDSKYSRNVFKWHHDFWSSIEKKFRVDLATLNYDTCIEQSLPHLEDGFEETDYTFKRFNPKKLFLSKESKILHLHGCINYGYARTQDANEYTLQDDFDDLYKYPSYKNACETWFGRSSNISQSSEEALVGPIITGLKKTDKGIHLPYSSYFNTLHNAVINNNSLLIIGYSFGDIHINRLLERLVKIHEKKRKVVIISYYAGSVWHRDWQVMGWPENREMMVFASKAFQDYYPFSSGSFSGPPEVITSRDGCARIYLKGFKHTAETHGSEIINFLAS